MVPPNDGLEGLRDALTSVLTTKSRAARVRVGCGDAYLYVARERGASTLSLVAPSTRHLPEGRALGQPGAQWLRREGFERAGGGRSFTLRLPPPANLDDLGRRCREVLSRAYECATDAPLTVAVTHDDRDHPGNDEIVDAMRRLAGSRTHDDRLRLYNELVNGTFLVPVALDADPSDDGADVWFDVGDDGETVFAIFTDLSQLRAWRLETEDYLPMHGAEFFEEFMESAAVGLRINPGGTVGGELYRHEVELIVRGIHHWRKTTSS